MKNEFHFGKGKISATLSLFLGSCALGGVLCFYFPQLFSTAELRSIYPIGLIRTLIDGSILLSSAFALISITLGYNPKFALMGFTTALLAALLGGGGVEVDESLLRDHGLGLDWFLLDIFLLSFIFIPLEKIFPHRSEQKLFRSELKTDLFYFAVNHLLFQVLLYLTSIPARMIQLKFGVWSIGEWVKSVPVFGQFLIVLFIMDLFQYWVHRLFHKNRVLWRFHAVHHSVEEMDWIAGSRLHLMDVIITRSVVFLPFHLAGFDKGVLEIYAVFAAFQTVFIHANVKWRMNWLNMVLATPSYHHWHHSSDKEALDKNFAVHLPVLDILFGTYYHPRDLWPKNYGLFHEKIPRGYIGQFFYPFKVKSKNIGKASPKV